MRPAVVIEVETATQAMLDAGTSLAGARLQGLDLRALGHGRAMAGALHPVDSHEDAVEILTSS